jgi:hypothetical protein
MIWLLLTVMCGLILALFATEGTVPATPPEKR